MASETGRLFKVKLHHNHQARRTALASVRQLPNGQWQARLGGVVRGQAAEFPSRRAAEQAVHAHYNEAMMRNVLAVNAKDRP